MPRISRSVRATSAALTRTGMFASDESARIKVTSQTPIRLRRMRVSRTLELGQNSVFSDELMKTPWLANST